MPEERRRARDIQPDDSIITKAAKMELGGPVMDKLLRTLVILAVSGGAGSFVSEKKGIDVSNLQTQLQEARRDVEELKAEQQRKWSGYYRNVRHWREDDVCYERRFTRLETKVGLGAPTCGVRHEEPPAEDPQ